MLSLIPWWRWCLPGFFAVKLVFSPFLITKYLVGTCENHIPHQTFINYFELSRDSGIPVLLNGLECISAVCFDVQIVPGLFQSLHADFCGVFFFFLSMCPRHFLSISLWHKIFRLILLWLQRISQTPEEPWSLIETKIWVLEWSSLLGYHYSNALQYVSWGIYAHTCSFPFIPAANLSLFFPSVYISVCWNPGFILIVPLLIQPQVHSLFLLSHICTSSPAGSIIQNIITYLISSPVYSQFHVTATSNPPGCSLTLLGCCSVPGHPLQVTILIVLGLQLGWAMALIASRCVLLTPRGLQHWIWGQSRCSLTEWPLDWTVGKAFKERLC